MNPEQAHPLFLYGTLRDSEILAAVLGREVPPEEIVTAVAPGWRAVYYPGAVYPALIPGLRHAAEGVVLKALPPADHDRLDAFEGVEYRRGLIDVTLGAETIAAWAYLPSVPIAPDAPGWTLDEWNRLHRANVLETQRREAHAACRAGG